MLWDNDSSVAEASKAVAVNSKLLRTSEQKDFEWGSNTQHGSSSGACLAGRSCRVESAEGLVMQGISPAAFQDGKVVEDQSLD